MNDEGGNLRRKTVPKSPSLWKHTVNDILGITSCADPEGGGDRGIGPPLKNNKNIGFLSNTGSVSPEIL